MATIITMSDANQSTTDEVKADLNANFANLNTDKIEADSTDTLTNKTIDASSNTISNITPAMASSASGSDTTFITGTAGSTDELGKFNADGDLVTSGVSISTSTPTGASDDTTVPTSQAVYNALSAGGTGTRPAQEVYYANYRFDSETDTVTTSGLLTASAINYVPIVMGNAAQTDVFWFGVNIPTGVTAVTATLQTVAFGGTVNMTAGEVEVFDMDFDGAISAAADTATITNNYGTQDEFTRLDVSDAFTIADIGTGVKQVKVYPGVSYVKPVWLKLEYTY